MRAPQNWLALLRIVVGAWFIKAVWTKLAIAWLWGMLPYIAVSPRFIAFQPKRVAEFASAVTWYKDFLENVVLPRASTFAALQAYAEVIVGIGLLLGFCVAFSSLLGLFLTINYAYRSSQPRRSPSYPLRIPFPNCWSPCLRFFRSWAFLWVRLC